MNQLCFCAPTNKKQLIKYADGIRKIFKIEEAEEFPILKVLDLAMDDPIFNNFSYQVVEDDDEIFDEEKQLAFYSFQENTIYIKSSQYDSAKVDPRSRFTLTHEFAHMFLMQVTNRKPKLKDDDGKGVQSFSDPEWQANRLAGYILIPERVCQKLNEKEIEKQFFVSPECAVYRKINSLKDNIDIELLLGHSDTTVYKFMITETTGVVIDKITDNELVDERVNNIRF
jgi:Zn-dependent peptidase ImmA (M78 family)